MAALALTGYVAFILLGCVGRTGLQYWHTGDHGLRMHTHRLNSIESAAGALFLAGALAAGIAPTLALLGLAAPTSGIDSTVSHLAGIVSMALGLIVTIAAQLQMGASWRIGVDSREATRLVTTGLFAYVRNPIFTGTTLTALGMLLMVPTLITVFALAAVVAGVQLQVRQVEEPYLLRLHREHYRTYASAVGRFLPYIGRLS